MWWLAVLLPAVAVASAAAGGAQAAGPPRTAPGAAIESVAAVIARSNIGRARKASQAAGPTLEASEGKAVAAEQKAAAALQVIQSVSAENNAVVPLVAGERAEAGVALKTAQDAVAEAQRILVETEAATKAAALQSAREYLLEVKKAGAKAAADAAAATAAAESKAEISAAKAAAKAAEPYHTAIIRGQKVAHEYMNQAQQDAAASNALKYQAIQLNGAARTYQFMNHPIEAQQLFMQADELMRDGGRYKDEALHLRGIVAKVSGLIPAYYEVAEEAASQAASAGGNIPTVELPYLLQVGDLRRALRGPGHAAPEPPKSAS